MRGNNEERGGGKDFERTTHARTHAHTQRATPPGERVQRKANPPPAPTLSSHIIPHQAASL